MRLPVSQAQQARSIPACMPEQHKAMAHTDGLSMCTSVSHRASTLIRFAGQNEAMANAVSLLMCRCKSVRHRAISACVHEQDEAVAEMDMLMSQPPPSSASPEDAAAEENSLQSQIHELSNSIWELNQVLRVLSIPPKP